TNLDRGTATLATGLTVNAGPTLTASTPAVLGQGALAQTMTLTGTGFAAPMTVTSSNAGVTFGAVTVVSATSATVPVSVAAGAVLGASDIVVVKSDGGRAVRVGALTVTVGPAVSSITPTALAQGAAVQTITVNGSNFVSGATVTFGAGVSASAATFVSSTRLLVNVTVDAAAVAGVRDVVVTNPDQGRGVLAGGFTVTARPTLTSVTPASAGQGAVSRSLAVVGTGFQAGITAVFSGTGVTVDSLTVNSATSLTVVVSVAAGALTGARSLTVTNLDRGTATLATGLTVNAAPTVASLTPSTRSVGALNQSIVIAGTGFAAGATVAFSSASITVNSVVVNSATQITANVSVSSAAAIGAYDITVRNADGGGVTGVGALSLVAAPTVTSASPTSMGVGATSRTVTVTGTGFQAGSTATFSGTGITVNSVTLVSATTLSLLVTVASGSTLGPRDLTVNSGGANATLAGAISLTAAPTVTAFATSTASSAAGQGAVTRSFNVTGTGFASGATVEFSGTGVTVNSVTFVSSTSLTVVVSVLLTATVGARDVRVVNPDFGTGTRVGGLTITAAPSLTSLTPNSRAQGALNSSVTVAGTGFQTGAVATFSGTLVTATTTSATATSLVIAVTVDQNAATGLRSITVTNPDGGTRTLANSFTVLAGPKVTSLSPASLARGAAATTITINGSGFVTGTTVFFSGLGLTLGAVTVVSATQLRLTVAVATTATIGLRGITVTTPSNGGRFTSTTIGLTIT
ncbi:MAG: beta strand repeat-containing protein, partial [Ilumatobacteraceae bacterium]